MSGGGAGDMFRAEAVAHHVQGVQEGDILRYDHTWTRHAYTLVVIACLVGFAFISIFSVDEWATGTCVVRIDGRQVLTAKNPATVDTVEGRTGQAVEPGQVIVMMNAQEEAKEYASATKEFELALVRMMRDPNDGEAKANLTSLRARRESSKTVFDARRIVSPISGTITDVRVRPGQRVNPGDVLATVAPKSGGSQASITAIVPADYRPMLEPGQKMRFELDGFRYIYADLKVEEISAEAVGPTEVMRMLGQEKADSVAQDRGAKVLVSAKLPSSTFTSEGQAFGYFDGLTGTAEIRVRREPILVLLIPALRALLPNEALVKMPGAS
ncbi:MAG: HlyD family efflux transporter periplasmic adaptor subunit [Myxococcales bacterium]|nr:HlyD family efflux transporter periplasmic adaptor subunit [Myxococcales bacterium]